MVADEGFPGLHQPETTRSLGEIQRIRRCLDRSQSASALCCLKRDEELCFVQSGKGGRRYAVALFLCSCPQAVRAYHGDSVDPDSEPSSHMFVYHSAVLFSCLHGYQVNYLNRNRTLANVRLQWAKDGDMGQERLNLDRSPSFMYGKPAPGLFSDVVAARYIAEGEELYIDYGGAWERAWLDHVAPKRTV